jgi:DNA invertase Pin-like site-specific DNA recombinase
VSYSERERERERERVSQSQERKQSAGRLFWLIILRRHVLKPKSSIVLVLIHPFMERQM